MEFKQTTEYIVGAFVGLAIVVTLVSANNTPKVISSVFGGASGLFGSIMKPINQGGGGFSMPTGTVTYG